MNWKPATAEGDKVTVPPTWIHLPYYDALNVLFRVENSLRMFVYIILKAHHAEHWKSLSIASDEGKAVTIAAATAQRRSQDEAYGYVGFPATCPLLYLTSGELIRLIIDESNWKHFRPYFIASREIVKTKLDEIGNVRNALAHFRPMRPEDVSLLKQNAMHVLRRVEGCLQQVLTCSDTVPTNIDEAWYRTLVGLGSESCQLSFRQSSDGKWVQVRISYRCKVLHSKAVGNWRSYRVTTLKTTEFLEFASSIRNAVIFLTERVPHISMPDDDIPPPFVKAMAFTFSRTAIMMKADEIAAGIKGMLEKIEQKTELVGNDHLARGRLVYATPASAVLNKEHSKGYWQFDVRNLRLQEDMTDAPEYLGSLDSMVMEDFITDTPRFAWMPVDVSQYDGVPF